MPSNPEAWRVFYKARSASSAEAETLRDIRRLYIKCKENSETYLYDGRGGVVQLLQGGTVAQSYSYNAYGYINVDEYGIRALFYGYNGEQHDPATGLQYLRARYYALQNGSFVTQDSFAGLLTDALSQNRYAYAQNNPVTFADPSGHSIWDSIKNGVTNAVKAVGNVVNKVSSVVSSAVTAVKNVVTGTAAQPYTKTSPAAAKQSSTAPPAVSAPSPVNNPNSTGSGGAAKAAQIANIPNASGKLAANIVGSVLSNSFQPLKKDDPGLIPGWATNILDAIKSLGRGVCDANEKYLETQLELEQAEMQSWKAMGKTLGQAFQKYSEFAYRNEQLNNGSVATYIPKYFGEKGYDVHLNLAPTPEELEWMAQEYDTVIITHYNTPSLFGGSHYMNLYYDNDANQYVVNNWENRQSYPEILPNMDKLYGEGFNRVYYAYGISKGEE